MSATISMATRDTLVLAFLGLSVLSGITVGFAARNYLEFFPAMEQITVQIVSTESQTVDQVLRMVVRFALENPTSYSGLSVKSFRVSSISFEEPDGTVLSYGPSDAPFGQTTAIPPNSRLDFVSDIPFLGVWRPVGESFVNDTIAALLHVSILLSTFLDSISWISLNYDCALRISDEKPLVCERGPTTAVSRRGGGGGA